MSFMSKSLLLISLIILFFNAFPSGYIIYQIQLGDLYGNILFIFSCLLGAVIASFVEEGDKHTRFYSLFCMISNIIVAFYPLYMVFSSKHISPYLMKLL